MKALETLHSQSDKSAIISGGYAFWEDNCRPIRSIYNVFHFKCINNNFKYLKKSPFFGFPKPVLIQSTIFKSEFLNEVTTWKLGYKLDDFPLFYKIFSTDKYQARVIFQLENEVLKYRRHSNNISNNQLSMLDLVISSYQIIDAENRALYMTETALYYLIQAIRNGNFSGLRKYFSYIYILSTPLALLNMFIFLICARATGYYKPITRS